MAIKLFISKLLTIKNGKSEKNIHKVRARKQRIDLCNGWLYIELQLFIPTDICDPESCYNLFLPVLSDGKSTYALPPLIIDNSRVSIGDTAFYSYNEFDKNYCVFREKSKNGSIYTYQCCVPFEHVAEFSETIDMEEMGELKSDRNLLPVGRIEIIRKLRIYRPDFKVSFVRPDIFEIKSQRDFFRARIEFLQGESLIFSGIRDNKKVLDEIEKTINDYTNNEDITVKRIYVSAWLAPDGDFKKNIQTSGERAEALASQIVKRYKKVNFDRISADIQGENWRGLYGSIEKDRNLSITEKNDLLQILKSTEESEERKIRIKEYNKGITYRYLLNNIYPRLTYMEYHIKYDINPITPERARLLIKDKPWLLNLKEITDIGFGYPNGSKEFEEVVDIAYKTYPSNPISAINKAAIELRRHNLSLMDKYLLPHTFDKRSYNNSGIYFMLIHQTEKAEEFFKKAIEAGDKNAVYNLKELSKLNKSLEAYRQEVGKHKAYLGGTRCYDSSLPLK